MDESIKYGKEIFKEEPAIVKYKRDEEVSRFYSRAFNGGFSLKELVLRYFGIATPVAQHQSGSKRRPENKLMKVIGRRPWQSHGYHVDRGSYVFNITMYILFTIGFIKEIFLLKQNQLMKRVHP